MTIEVIEIRRASNGYVISCIQQQSAQYAPRAYNTYVCNDDPSQVAAVIEQAIRECPITMEAIIPPARALP